jgi:hypothetical protein
LKHECDVRVTARQLNFTLCRAQPRMAEYRHHFRSRGDRFGHEGARREQPFRRYTNIPALLYLRKERKITLLNPASWDDKNGSYFLLLYREKKNLQSVLALCFTPAFETYHHLRLFAEGSSGVCISFNQEGLLKAVNKQVGVTARSVRYLILPDIRAMRMKTASLPFLKRSAFEDEREFRIIYESSTEKYDTIDIAIPLSCIDRITLSPWIPSTLSDHVKSTIKEIDGCSDGGLSIHAYQ